ncbi:SMP-LTD domain-containing protein [Mycena sanguinolenta]|uniref:SMP-LTD domain-containing protein n=1 Tax=Mycena sanguinolenta TaxID=230812 RepID=A0A8H6XBW4_9AGAR|nr:SMP-LTD domain-containing protein [Mycena sanguinolenta]
MTLKALWYAYILGGLTFWPIVLAGLIYFTIYTSVPVGDPDVSKKRRAQLAAQNDPDDADTVPLAASDINDVPKTRKGWLTVRRTFEESSLEGGYVGMVRSFLDSRSKDPKRSRPKDMWYVALKGKVLYLYEDETMTECEAAIELGSHDVTIYPEGLLDGEMYARRNAICLKPKSSSTDKSMPSVTKEMGSEGPDVDEKVAEGGSDSKKTEKEREHLAEEARFKETAREEALDRTTPWFIFVRATVEMEDWYLALIHASDHPPKTPFLTPLQPIFSPSDMNHLVNTLDEQPDVIPMRWLNALIGRIFFSFYRTHFLEDFIIGRFMKKLSKVKRPTFLTDIVVTEVSVGNKTPTFSKPMLKELTKEGDASLEVHLLYKGEFRITIEATASINLGSRFKPYLVKLVLAAVLREIEGNLLIKVKRPPSNRIWYAFTQTPRMVWEVEPIVSDRQITWSMITSTLESSLKTIIQDSVAASGLTPHAKKKPPTSVSEQVPDDDGSVASVPLPQPPSVPPSIEVDGIRSQSAAELSTDPSVSASPPNGELSWTSSYSSAFVAMIYNPWLSGMDMRRRKEERGRTADVDKSPNPRSRSTPSASDPAPPQSSEESDDSHLQPPSRSSSIWRHTKSNSVEEYSNSKAASEPSTSLGNGTSPTTSFLSTLKSRDKQAISNTAKEAMRKWSANWGGLMKDKNASESSSTAAGDEMPDHGSFVSRFRGSDSQNSTPQKTRASYAEVRAAVAERRGKERAGDRSPGPSSTTAPIPIPEVRERAVTMQPGRPSQNGSASPSFMARAATAAVDSAKRLSPSQPNLELEPSETPTPPPIQLQPQAKMMTIPGIHASHRGEVMSMGYVAPQPPPSPEMKVKNPAIKSVYRLWKGPAASAEVSSDTTEAASSSSSLSSSRTRTTDEESAPPPVPASPPMRPTPPPLPPRTARTPSLSDVSRPSLSPPRLSDTAQPSASEALQSIANKDKRASLELGLGFPPSSSPPSRRSTLGSRTPSTSGGDEEVPAPPTPNPGPPLPPRKPTSIN